MERYPGQPYAGQEAGREQEVEPDPRPATSQEQSEHRKRIMREFREYQVSFECFKKILQPYAPEHIRAAERVLQAPNADQYPELRKEAEETVTAFYRFYHATVIEIGLILGREIPVEVLKEYPELQEKYSVKGKEEDQEEVGQKTGGETEKEIEQ